MTIASRRKRHFPLLWKPGSNQNRRSLNIARKSRLCPKYHDEGLCELGPDCPMVHEENSKYFSSLDPNAPEFFPRSARKSFTASASFERSGNVAEVNILGRRLICPAIRHRYPDSGERVQKSKTRPPAHFCKQPGDVGIGRRALLRMTEKKNDLIFPRFIDTRRRYVNGGPEELPIRLHFVPAHTVRASFVRIMIYRRSVIRIISFLSYSFL
ncbi:uncharacterized protein LOC143465497 [Clavelina lepadiformis]|uniref:uncharacterized protein LOC143465497 n=1 Tax=Clavelina lepadiformis TaxID=159417 RepID=UPI004042C52A